MSPFDRLSALVALPPEIDHALRSGFDLAVSISGGKDSDAMAYLLHQMRFRQKRGWNGRFLLLHADLGRAEHRLTPRYIARFAQKIGSTLQVLEGRDLVDVMKARRDKLQAQGREVPFWPSARARYCTSDLKRTPISVFLRQWSGKQGRVICAIGLRAEESATRAKKAIYQPRSGVHTQSRLAYDWLPLHDFQLADIWATLGYTLEELKTIQTRSQGLVTSVVILE